MGAGHTEWIDARSSQSCFTTTFTPNSKVLFVSGGTTYDIDFTSRREGKTANVPTYTVSTARSFHVGIVNALLVDGSVRGISDLIDSTAWRSIGTPSGGEVISGDSY